MIIILSPRSWSLFRRRARDEKNRRGISRFRKRCVRIFPFSIPSRDETFPGGSSDFVRNDSIFFFQYVSGNCFTFDEHARRMLVKRKWSSGVARNGENEKFHRIINVLITANVARSHGFLDRSGAIKRHR